MSPRKIGAKNKERSEIAKKSATKEKFKHKDKLEEAIGRQVRAFRKELKLTVTKVAEAAGLSPGMLSKIENGNTSPSLATLSALSSALDVPVTAFFRKYEEQRDCAYVRAGQGLMIDRLSKRAGHQYALLGHTVGKQFAVEPYLITITEKSEVFPLFQHDGVEFIYLLKGKLVYRYADRTYTMSAGDSLCFDSDVPHGPEKLGRLPIAMISIIISPRADQV